MYRNRAQESIVISFSQYKSSYWFMSAFEKGDQWDLEWKILYWSIHLRKQVLNFWYNAYNEGKRTKKLFRWNCINFGK